MSSSPAAKPRVFTNYQVFVIAVIAFIQFTVILDFMVLSPLGVMLLEQLNVKTSQFGLVVSAYAFSAGISGLLAAGFADKFDRKKLLLFFYAGFMGGTLFCALAPSYPLLLAARIVTGIFGGVIGSISMAIITDLFALQVRGRVMGFVQTAFAASQVLGLPIGLLLANHFGWHAPFWMIACLGTIVGIVIFVYMKPVADHLKIRSDRNPFLHLFKTVSQPHYRRSFLATMLMATGGFMLMPFGSAFSIHNLGLKLSQLPLLYGITGICSIVFGPLLGKLSDRIGKYKVFVMGSTMSITMVLVYTHLGFTPFWVIALLNIVLFTGISSRMIASSALISAIPEPQDRGAFMSESASIQQISGAVAAYIAGLIVFQSPSGELEHYPTLGYVVAATIAITIVMMYFINQYVSRKKAASPAVIEPEKEMQVVSE